MAGFNHTAGRSNNMVAAEERGMEVVSTWGKRHGVSAAAALAVMRPSEAHHTGTGRRGKSRLTYVLSGTEPTTEQLEAMREHDRAAKAAKSAPPIVVHDCALRFVVFGHLTGNYGRIIRRNCVPQEEIRACAEVHIFATGEVAAVMADGAQYGGYQKKSGLIIAKDGMVIFAANVNDKYDDAKAIAARIAPRAAN